MRFLPLALFLLLVSAVLFPIHAQVVINEFSPQSSPDWVELYNNSDEPIDLSDHTLTDNTTSGNTKSFSCILAPHGFTTVDWSNKLNKAGDTVRLRKGEEVIDCVSYGDGNGSTCLGGEEVDIEVVDYFAVRSEDGGGIWQTATESTKDNPNDGSNKSENASCADPPPSPTPSPSPTPTPQPPKSPTPTQPPTGSNPVGAKTLTPTSSTPKPENLTPNDLTLPPDGTVAGATISSISLSAFTINPSPEPEPEQEEKKSNAKTFLFAGSGLAFIAASGSHLYKQKKSKSKILDPKS